MVVVVVGVREYSIHWLIPGELTGMTARPVKYK